MVIRILFLNGSISYTPIEANISPCGTSFRESPEIFNNPSPPFLTKTSLPIVYNLKDTIELKTLIVSPFHRNILSCVLKKTAFEVETTSQTSPNS